MHNVIMSLSRQNDIILWRIIETTNFDMEDHADVEQRISWELDIWHTGYHGGVTQYVIC